MAVIKKLTDGTYRILTLPYKGKEHIFGDVISIRCAFNGLLEGPYCPLCSDRSSTNYWLIGVLNRLDNIGCIYRLDYKYFKQIQSFARQPIWGDPTSYDIEVRGDDIFALWPNKPLSGLDKEIQSNIDIDAIKDSVKPWPVGCVENAYREFKEKLGVLL